MRYGRFEFEKNSPFFKPPKYTGITLSLLSIFVLVSMLAVWEKMARVPDLPVLQILAWEKAKVPLENVRLTYQKEASCVVNISYCSNAELSSLLDLKKPGTKQTWDILLIPENNESEFFLNQNNFDMRSLVAYFNETSEKSKDSDSLCFWLNRTTKTHAEALSFLRFLKAPTKGQVEFAINDWTGVSDDHWIKSPRLTIYAVNETESILHSYAQKFANERSLDLRISFLNEHILLKTLQILTKADEQNYLPDLIFLPAKTSNLSFLLPFYSEIKNSKEIFHGNYILFLRQKSPLLKTIQTFLRVLSEHQ